MEIHQIQTSDTYPIRQQMLRPNGTVADCHFQRDDDELTFHLGAFIENKLVSVASFYFNNNEFFDDQYQYQLRGMATLPEFQKKGLSRALLKVAFPIIKQNQGALLWCNAREVAVGFYKTMDFKIVGPPFEIPGIGTHYLMVKQIG